jgi:hypothetical protein
VTHNHSTRAKALVSGGCVISGEINFDYRTFFLKNGVLSHFTAIPLFENLLPNFDLPVFFLVFSEKGLLLEIHLLEKTARHQNLDCSTPFEQMNKYMKLLESTFSKGLTRFEQMSIILLSARNVEQ